MEPEERFLAPPLGAARALGLAGFAVAARLATLVLTAGLVDPGSLHLRVADLAAFFDGHSYLMIARSFPTPYAGLEAVFPGQANPADLTAWLPFYPFLVWLANALLGDLRVAALAVSMACSAAAVLLFYRVARQYTDAALPIAALFAVFPPTWLEVGSLSYTEPALLALALGSIAALLDGRIALGGLLCGFAIVTQKQGILLVPILLANLWSTPGRPWRANLPFLLFLVPPLLLEAWLTWLTNDPFVTSHALHKMFGSRSVMVPFGAFVAGLLHPDPTMRPDLAMPRAVLSTLSLGFYAGALALELRARRAGAELLLGWLGVALGFTVCLSAPWGYLNFARYALMGAPPALLLWQHHLARTRIGWPRWAALAVAPCAVLLAAWMAAVGIESMLTLGLAPYFERFLELVR